MCQPLSLGTQTREAQKKIALEAGALMGHHESYSDLCKEIYKQNVSGHEVMN